MLTYLITFFLLYFQQSKNFYVRRKKNLKNKKSGKQNWIDSEQKKLENLDLIMPDLKSSQRNLISTKQKLN